MNHFFFHISPVTGDTYICMHRLLPPQSLVSIMGPLLSCFTGPTPIAVLGRTRSDFIFLQSKSLKQEKRQKKSLKPLR